MKRVSIIHLGVLASLSLAGFAQEPTTRDLDRNKSQSTTTADRDRAGKSGYSAAAAHDWDHQQFDLDKDGRVSKSEFEQAFSRMDTDRDGYLLPNEFCKGKSDTMTPIPSDRSPGSFSSDSKRKSDTKKP
jgi:hypothetical protein